MSDRDYLEITHARELYWNYQLQVRENGKQAADKWMARAFVYVSKLYGTSERVREHMRSMWRDAH